jgi:flagellar secretion chaperone FliS
MLSRLIKNSRAPIRLAVSIYNSYLETEVLSADPIRLVQLLYRSATGAVSAARYHLAAGAIRERSQQVTKALSILHELIDSLNREKGGEIATNLAGLYSYMTTRLIEANVQQIDGPLEEVERLLITLGEAWAPVLATAA